MLSFAWQNGTQGLWRQRFRDAAVVRPNPRLQRTRLRAPLSRKPLGGPKHYLISRRPGQHVSQAGRGEQRAEVSREDRLATR